MESVARAKYLRGSAQKMRLVADMVRNKPVNKAISMLHDGLSQKASGEIEQVIRAAAANLQSKQEGSNVDIDDLFVKSIVIDKGPSIRRIKARAQGRAFLRMHPMCHITVKLSD